MTTFPPDVTRELLRDGASAAGYPAIEVPELKLSIAGREAWDRVLWDVTIPRHRLAILKALEVPILTRTPQGRRRWEADLAEMSLSYYGDPELFLTVKMAERLLPERVRRAVCALSAWLGVAGQSVRAWTCPATFLGEDGQAKRRLVMVSGAATIETCLHESLHVFESIENATAMTALADEALKRTADDALRARLDTAEAAARAMARLWSLGA